MHKLLLASSSIYRRELLSRLLIPFTTFSSDIDETPLPGESWQALVLRLAKEKAKVATISNPNTVCIGSDEVAALGKVLLGKPGTHEQAIEQLKIMSGQKVHFYTGVCVYAPFLNHEDSYLAITSVLFRDLSDNMIENYLLKEKPYQSAGSFKSETLGSALVERIETDDPTAIIGLPLIQLCKMLERVGILVL